MVILDAMITIMALLFCICLGMLGIKLGIIFAGLFSVTNWIIFTVGFFGMAVFAGISKFLLIQETKFKKDQTNASDEVDKLKNE